MIFHTKYDIINICCWSKIIDLYREYLVFYKNKKDLHANSKKWYFNVSLDKTRKMIK